MANQTSIIAVHKVLLKKKTFTLSEIGRQCKLNTKTVRQCLELLQRLGKAEMIASTTVTLARLKGV